MRLPGRLPGLAGRGRSVLLAGLAGLALVAVMTVGADGGPAAAASTPVAGATPPTGALTSASATSTTVPWVVGTGGTLTVGIDEAPTGCNPDVASGDTWADRLVLAPVLPSAFQVNAKDQPTYDPAVINQAELQSTSPQTVVYSINPKAVWSDGVPISAADFIYTWQQERGTGGPIGSAASTTAAPTAGSSGSPTSSTSTSTSGGTGSAGTASTTTTTTAPVATGPTTLPGATGTTGTLMGYRQIKSVKGSNHGRTVTVVFRTPYADWQALFDDLLPAHVLQKVGWTPSCTTVNPSIDLSGGPYVISSAVPGKQVVLVRNRRWWEQPGYARRIVIKFASSPAQLAGWVAKGRVQVALPRGFDRQFVQRVTASPTLESQGQETTTFLQLEFSTTGPETSAVAVRQAVAHAIDRQQLVNQIVGWADTSIVPAVSHLYAENQSGYPSPRQLPIQIAGQSAATTTTLPSTPTPQDPFPTTADLTTAGRLLSEVGFARQADGTWRQQNGRVLTLRMAVDTGDSWAARTAPLLVHQLQAAGIPTTVVDEPTATAAGSALASGAADMALLPMHATPYGSTAIAWYTTLLGAPGHGGSQDWSNFQDPTLDNLLVQASQQLNPVDASPLYTNADMLLWQQMVALPLFTEPTVLSWSGSVGGVVADPNGPNLLTTVTTWGLKVPPTSPRAAKTQTPSQ